MKTGTIEINVDENFKLRKFKFTDAQSMFDFYCNDPDVTKYVFWDMHGNVENTKAYLNSFLSDYEKPDYYHWAIANKSDDNVVGAVGVVNFINETKEYELGWVVGKSLWNKGITTKCAKKVIDYLFSQDAHLISAKFDPRNLGSGRVMSKLNMCFIGVVKDEHSEKVPEIDAFIKFGITKKEYLKLQGKN